MAKKKRRRKKKQKREQMEEPEHKSSFLRSLLSTLLYIAVVLAVTFFIINFVGQRTRVSGESMENTLDDGDQLIVDKITYRFKDPERFDIIVFPYKYKENTYYIKRIIGLPGETVEIRDGYVYIDGEILAEAYGREVMKDAGIAASPITLADDEYFVLGDNRNASSDSRDPSVGLIKREDIIGRAFMRIWPLRSFGILRHR